MQTCSEVITEHPTPWGAKSIVCWIACGNSSFCWQQQMGVQAPSAPLNRTPPKNGCTYSTPGTVASFTLENLFSNGDPTRGP